MSDLNSKLQYVDRVGNTTEHFLRNSLQMKELMQFEEIGLGHWTISQLLNHLQDLNTNGETELFYDLSNRKKRI
ncbi:hypothetical protein [Paenibacillus sp. 1P03SA]|uniref:hypothetical protein n=1 Tax=Paenibacillus sp. 1P03SA TaxID=3132294 RepID=UPI00399F1D61